MIEQRSDEWFALRAGKFTGSRFADVLARSKRDGKPTKAYHDLIVQIAIERITGEPAEQIDAKALRWGRDVEEFARMEYMLESGLDVEECGFIQHPQYEFVGSSPDGLIADDGLIEIKCPKNSAIHIETLLHGMPEAHVAQVQGNMWVTNRRYSDFISFDPRMPESKRLYINRIIRDDEYIKALEDAVLEANRLVENMMREIMA